MERSYTVHEIDALREVVERKWLYGTYHPGSGFSRSYNPEKKAACVEQMVRTHMLAGHTAGDLLNSENGAKFDEQTMLSCPECRKSYRVQGDKLNPKNAARIIVLCPECDDGGNKAEALYFDKDGRQIDCDGNLL